LDWEDLEKVEADNDFVEKALEIFGQSISGYNPLDYIEMEE
jgi:hypothetical protein